MGKAENEAKKEFLWSYRDSVRRLERISAEIEEIRAMRMGVSAGTGGTGRRGWKNDLSAYAAQLDSLERGLDEEWKTKVCRFKEILDAINSLETSQEQDVLFYRYIKGMPLWEIAEKMKYSERHVRRLHGLALSHLKIKDVLECPE